MFLFLLYTCLLDGLYLTSLTVCWVFSSQKRKALTWSDPKVDLDVLAA